jgi:hypothetical protein
MIVDEEREPLFSWLLIDEKSSSGASHVDDLLPE